MSTLNTILTHRIDKDSKTISRRLDYLSDLLNVDKKSVLSKKNPESSLCIIGELFCNLFDKPPIDLNDINIPKFCHCVRDYNLDNDYGKNARQYIYKNLDRFTITRFFLYFIKNERWLDFEYYKSDEEFTDTLVFLNDYFKILACWNYVGNDKNDTSQYDKIKDLARALYDRKHLYYINTAPMDIEDLDMIWGEEYTLLYDVKEKKFINPT